MHVSRHFKSYDTLHIVFFALSSTAGYLLSGLRQPSHPARIFSGILPDSFYLLPARRLPAHVTLVSFLKFFFFWVLATTAPLRMASGSLLQLAQNDLGPASFFLQKPTFGLKLQFLFDKKTNFNILSCCPYFLWTFASV